MREKQEAYVYDKTRRYEVAVGTRCTNVLMDIPWSDVRAAGRPSTQTAEAVSHETRKIYTAKAIEAAADLWWIKYGEPVPWQTVEIFVSHVTAQVIVEFRVTD